MKLPSKPRQPRAAPHGTTIASRPLFRPTRHPWKAPRNTSAPSMSAFGRTLRFSIGISVSSPEDAWRESGGNNNSRSYTLAARTHAAGEGSAFRVQSPAARNTGLRRQPPSSAAAHEPDGRQVVGLRLRSRLRFRRGPREPLAALRALHEARGVGAGGLEDAATLGTPYSHGHRVPPGSAAGSRPDHLTPAWAVLQDARPGKTGRGTRRGREARRPGWRFDCGRFLCIL